jgi:hypothetical protein
MSISGVGRSAPFLKTRTTPLFSAMKIRPSGAKANEVGRFRPETTVCGWNPAGALTAQVPVQPML